MYHRESLTTPATNKMSGMCAHIDELAVSADDTIWSNLPLDVTRIILSQQAIPCTTKVELQKTLGPLPGKVKIPEALEMHLGRILKRRSVVLSKDGTMRRLYKTYNGSEKKVCLEIIQVRDKDIPVYNMYIKKKDVQVRHFNMCIGANWQSATEYTRI